MIRQQIIYTAVFEGRKTNASVDQRGAKKNGRFNSFARIADAGLTIISIGLGELRMFRGDERFSAYIWGVLGLMIDRCTACSTDNIG